MTHLRWIALWAAVYGLLAAAIMFPTSIHPTRYKFGSFAVSDSLDSVYRLWAEAELAQEGGDGTLRNPYVGAPEGVPMVRVQHPTWWVARAASSVGGAVFGYNSAVFLGFLLSALLTHRLVGKLTGSEPAGLIAAVAFAFSPFHILQSGDHINLSQTWVFPLYFLALHRELVQRSWGSAVGLCAAVALALWIHGYYGLFLLIVSPFFFLHALWQKQLTLKRGEATRLAAIALTMVGIAIVYSASSQIVDASGVSTSLVERPLWHLQTLGVRWYEWFLPPYYSIAFGSLVREFLATRMHGSSPAEMTVFLGYVPLVLSVVWWIALLRRGHANPGGTIIARFSQCLAIALGVALVLSATPTIDLFGIELTMPSGLLHPVFPMLRALSRWAILPIFAVSSFAGMATLAWSAKLRPAQAWAAAAALTGLILFEYTPAHARLYLDSGRVPPVYEAVREPPDDHIVLELPVTALNDFIPYFWQMYHGHGLYNVPGRSHSRIEQILAFQGSDLEQILVRARALGIDEIVIHTSAALAIGRPFPAIRDPNAVVHPALPHSLLLSVAGDVRRGSAAQHAIESVSNRPKGQQEGVE